MKILVLATKKFAPTYNVKLQSQINYFNQFKNLRADVLIDGSLLEIEKKLSSLKYDLIYPTTVFEYNNDGTDIVSFNSYLYKLLEYYNQKYVGSPLFTHLMLNDKALTNLNSGMGLPNQIITRRTWDNARESALERLKTFRLPAIVKPNTLAASLGIDETSIVRDWKNFEAIIDNRFQNFSCLTEILVEYYLENSTEYTVSITGNSGKYLFNISKLSAKTENHVIHSFESKNIQPEKRHFTYSKEDDRIKQYRLQKSTEQIFEQLQLRDLARFDYLMSTENELYLIDANSLPSLSTNYLFEYISSGKIRLEQLLLLICLVAEKRLDVNINSELLSEYPKEIVRALF
jgi:D-alanine-D-alanine ligase-like ATP-grasp enzyme